MQAGALVELEHLVARDADPRPQRVVLAVGVRHDRVQAVVAALELDEDEQVAVAGRVPRRRRAAERA